MNYTQQKYILMGHDRFEPMTAPVQYNNYDNLTLEVLVNYTGISQEILLVCVNTPEILTASLRE